LRPGRPRSEVSRWRSALASDGTTASPPGSRDPHGGCRGGQRARPLTFPASRPATPSPQLILSGGSGAAAPQIALRAIDSLRCAAISADPRPASPVAAISTCPGCYARWRRMAIASAGQQAPTPTGCSRVVMSGPRGQPWQQASRLRVGPADGATRRADPQRVKVISAWASRQVENHKADSDQAKEDEQIPDNFHQ
jgi:hypothetical protein